MFEFLMSNFLIDNLGNWGLLTTPFFSKHHTIIVLIINYYLQAYSHIIIKICHSEQSLELSLEG